MSTATKTVSTGSFVPASVSLRQTVPRLDFTLLNVIKPTHKFVSVLLPLSSLQPLIVAEPEGNSRRCALFNCEMAVAPIVNLPRTSSRS